VLAHGAVGEEGISYYLACLASGGVSTRPEVGQVVRSAWLPRTTAWVTIDDASI
jgi:hypothetical protein